MQGKCVSSYLVLKTAHDQLLSPSMKTMLKRHALRCWHGAWWKAWTREIFKKVLTEEFYFADIPGSDSESLIVPAKKHMNYDISDDLTKKNHHGFNTCDLDGDTLTSPLPLDEHLRRCQMMHLINRDEGFETGHDWSCPAFTLCSICKHTIRLTHYRNELDLHPD